MTNVQRESAKFITAKEGAKLVNYTTDYIARLAREGKVKSMRQGRVWFVGRDSLKTFAILQEADKRQRQAELRDRRLAEKKAFELKKQTAELVDHSDLRNQALAGTVVASVSVLLTLVMMYSVATNRITVGVVASALSDISAQMQQAFALGSLGHWPFTEKDNVTPNNFWSGEGAVTKFKNLISLPGFDIESNEIVLESNGNQEPTEILEASFSDPVMVDVDGSGQGFVVPVFSEEKTSRPVNFRVSKSETP